jgi:hypothetical protein
MKNANIFVDVDLTLVDAKGKLLGGAREALEKLKEEGCHLFLWSSNGADYCKKIAQTHKLTELFEGFTAKPDIIIDDMPSTCVTSLIYNVQAKKSWADLADQIIQVHLD